jgi:hypothetical protein
MEKRKRLSTCTVCRHQERWRIELLKAGGAGIDALAAKFGVSRDAIFRHWHTHVTDSMKAGYLSGPSEMANLAAKAATEGDSVIDYLRICRTALTSQLAAASEAGDSRTTAYVAGQLTKTLETIGKLTGELGELARSSINITNNNIAIMNSPQFATLQATMLRALAPYPDARSAVVLALRDLDAEPAPAAPAVNEMRVIEHVA